MMIPPARRVKICMCQPCGRFRCAFPSVASLLERGQFSRRPLDARLSSQFLDGYLDALDGAHLLFLQCDLDEFDLFRPDLAQMTLCEGGTQPTPSAFSRPIHRSRPEPLRSLH